MRKVGILLLVAIVFSVVVGLYAAERAITLEGTLVDSKCYLRDNSLTGNDHGAVKGCGTICLKAGTPGAGQGDRGRQNGVELAIFGQQCPFSIEPDVAPFEVPLAVSTRLYRRLQEFLAGR